MFLATTHYPFSCKYRNSTATWTATLCMIIFCPHILCFGTHCWLDASMNVFSKDLLSPSCVTESTAVACSLFVPYEATSSSCLICSPCSHSKGCFHNFRGLILSLVALSILRGLIFTQEFAWIWAYNLFFEWWGPKVAYFID